MADVDNRPVQRTFDFDSEASSTQTMVDASASGAPADAFSLLKPKPVNRVTAALQAEVTLHAPPPFSEAGLKIPAQHTFSEHDVRAIAATLFYAKVQRGRALNFHIQYSDASQSLTINTKLKDDFYLDVSSKEVKNGGLVGCFEDFSASWQGIVEANRERLDAVILTSGLFLKAFEDQPHIMVECMAPLVARPVHVIRGRGTKKADLRRSLESEMVMITKELFQSLFRCHGVDSTMMSTVYMHMYNKYRAVEDNTLPECKRYKDSAQKVLGYLHELS